MNLPDEAQWLRVEQLAEQLNRLPAEKVAEYLSDLAAQGESPTVLTILGAWLSLPPPSMPLNVGSVLAGRYTLRSKLGEGGMGSVWRARQEAVGRDVAVKIIHPAIVTPALQARFVGEIELLGRLDHPGIVKVFDAGVHEQKGQQAIPFFAMELVDGEPLDQWSTTHREDHTMVLRVVAAVCQAVQSAHERRIVHRDLKPSNIIVRADGQPIVLDFGIARLAGMTGKEDHGHFTGTPHYAAPEQHLGRDGDFRSGESVDVYSIGVILFEILAGRKPFEFPKGTPLAEMRRAVLEDEVPRLSQVLPNCPAPLDEIVARALRRDPADRFYSVATLGRAIQRTALLSGPPENIPAPWTPSPGASIPGTGWRLLEKIGEGSAGQVWIGIHDKLQERRVFKFCDTEDKARTLKRELTLFRLLKERIGQNSHFVQLHEVSLDEPPWYLMMDYTEARDLESWCSEQPGGLDRVPEETRLEIVAQIAEALQAAHEAGILHRDIKPSNVLVQGNGYSVPIHVLIADFGIGQIISNELLRGGTRLGFTQTVSYLQQASMSGTMLYLAPEVIEGNAATARSDIYSLGVVLWQLLIGNLHTALDATDWPSRIEEPLLREDLNKCLAGSPAKRWASAGEFASSLRALADRRLVEVRRQEEIALRERVAYRRGVFRTTAVAVVILALMGWLAWFANQQRETASIARTMSALGELQSMAALQTSEARTTLLRDMPKLNIRGDALKSEFRNVASAILALPVFEPLEPSPYQLTENDSFSPNGERLIASDPKSGQIAVTDVTTEPPSMFALSNAPPGMSNLRVNDSGRAAGAIDSNGKLHLWHGPFLSKERTFSGSVYAGTFALTPVTLTKAKETAVAIARPDGSIDVYLSERPDEAPLHLLRKASAAQSAFPESSRSTMLGFSRAKDGILAAAGPESGILMFWNIMDQEKGPLTGKFAGAVWHPDIITCFGWNPTSQEIATGSREGILRVWKFGSSSETPQTEPLRKTDLGEAIRQITWSSDGSLLAVLLDSGKTRVLRSAVLDQPPVASLIVEGTTSLAFIVGNTLVTFGPAGSHAWGNRGTTLFREQWLSPSQVHIGFHQNGCLMASAADQIDFLNPASLAKTGRFRAESLYEPLWQGSALLFDGRGSWMSLLVEKDSRINALLLAKQPNFVQNLRFAVSSPGGRRSVWYSGTSLRCIKSNFQEEGVSAEISYEPQHLAVSEATAMTAWVDENQILHVRNHIENAEQSFQIGVPIIGLAFGLQPDLLACRTTMGVTFLNPRTRQTAACRLIAPVSVSSPLALSPDGTMIAACASNHVLVIADVPGPEKRWDNNGAALASLFSDPLSLKSPSAHRAASLAWNANGSRLVCGTVDGFIQSWNLSLLREKLRLLHLNGEIGIPPAEPDFVPIRLN